MKLCECERVKSYNSFALIALKTINKTKKKKKLFGKRKYISSLCEKKEEISNKRC